MAERLWAQVVPLPTTLPLLPVPAITDAIEASYQKYLAIHGVSVETFSFERKELVLEKKTLPLNPDRFCFMNFKLNSKHKRFSIVNKNAKTELSSYASHGIYTGNNTAFDFSNSVDTFKSSVGIFVSGTHYIGHFGPSIALHGISPTNDQVLARNIVIHGADYCSPEHIEKYGFLGRSLGCIALPKDKMISTFQILKPGTLIFTSSLPVNPKIETLQPPTPDEIVENLIK